MIAQALSFIVPATSHGSQDHRDASPIKIATSLHGKAPTLVGKISELSPAPDTRGLSERLRPAKNVNRAPQKHASQFSDGLIILKRGAEIAAGRPAGAPRHKRQAAADPSDAPQPPRVKAAAAQPPPSLTSQPCAL